MNKGLTTNDLDRMTSDDRWLGYGYLGERRNHQHWHAQAIAEADAAILDYANTNGWDYERLFAWANSKRGRWFGDELFGMGSLPRAMGQLQ